MRAQHAKAVAPHHRRVAMNATAQPPAGGACAPRRVYIDLGVNWANTLLQYRSHEPNVTASGITVWRDWEVYGFEASPLIQPYLEDHMAWLDGRRPDAPVLCVPPTGSSKHLALWAPSYGCPAAPPDLMRRCMWQKLGPQLGSLRPNPRLNSSALLDTRLRSAALGRRCSGGGGGGGGGGARAPGEGDAAAVDPMQQLRKQVAREPPWLGSPPAAAASAAGGSPQPTPPRARFTFLPAAAAAGGGFLWLWNSPQQLIRGGGHSSATFGGGGPKGGPPSEAIEEGLPHANWYYVRSVDVGRWISNSFAPRDHVVLKMDIEGAEHDLVRSMIATGSIQLVDTLLLECHADLPPKCLRMVRDVRQAHPSIKLVHEAKAFREQEDIDAEARVPEAASVAKRIAACNAAAAGGFTLFQTMASPVRRTSRMAGHDVPRLAASHHQPEDGVGASAHSTLQAPTAATATSDQCARLHASYNNYTRRGPCPFDRHLVEEISYLDGCPPPGLRLCIAPPLQRSIPSSDPASYPPTNADTAAAIKASAAVNTDEALLDTALEWRDFRPLRGFADVTFAAKTGRVPGLLESKDGQSWAGVEFPPEAARTKWRRYVGRLGTFVPLHAMRSAIDVGGGAGIFGQVLHAQYQNLTCITLTKDNSVGPRYYFE